MSTLPSAPHFFFQLPEAHTPYSEIRPTQTTNDNKCVSRLHFPFTLVFSYYSFQVSGYSIFLSSSSIYCYTVNNILWAYQYFYFATPCQILYKYLTIYCQVVDSILRLLTFNVQA